MVFIDPEQPKSSEHVLILGGCSSRIQYLVSSISIPQGFYEVTIWRKNYWYPCVIAPAQLLLKLEHGMHGLEVFIFVFEYD